MVFGFLGSPLCRGGGPAGGYWDVLDVHICVLFFFTPLSISYRRRGHLLCC